MVTSGYTVAECAYLLSGDAAATAYGPTEWIAMNGSWRAEWPASAEGFDDRELRLLMLVRPKRPGEPTVVYVVRGQSMRRVDVNGGHRGEHFSHNGSTSAPPARPCRLTGRRRCDHRSTPRWRIALAPRFEHAYDNGRSWL